MPRRNPPLVGIALLAGLSAAWACANEDEQPLAAPAATTGPSSSTASGPPPGPEPSTFYASLVAETQPGHAPAYLSLIHDTTYFVTFQLGNAFFYQAPPGEMMDPQLTASAQISADAKVGYCETEGPASPCVWMPIASLTAPEMLEPTSEYVASVSEPAPEEWHVVITAEPLSAPFRAVRGFLESAAIGTYSLEVLLADGSSLAFDLPPAGGYTPYQRAGDESAAVTAVRFVDEGGSSYEGALAEPLEGAYGFTVAIGEEPAAGALATVELESTR